MAEVSCDYCSSVDFKFDGRHMICRKCGCVTGRNAPPPEEPEVKPKPKKKPTRWKGFKYYRNMKRFRNVIGA